MADICIDLFSQLYSMLATAAANATGDTVRNLNPSSVGGDASPNVLIGENGESGSLI